MRAVIYCRVSSLEQTKNLSLETQEQACRQYCARNEYDVDEVFVDAGESAKTTDRPEFRRLLERCRRGRGQLHAVIVYSLTRFSRNSADHHAIAGLLRGLGIALRSVTEPIDDTPAGRLMEGILASMAQFDNDVRAQRVTAGLKAAVSHGRWCWPPPTGYLTGDNRRGPSLVPDPVRAPIVREAFVLFDAGVRGRELGRRLAAMGLTSTKRRAAPLSRAGLFKLLRQRAYAGLIQPKGWPETARGDFEPLVDEDLFWRVQAAIDGKPTRAARRKTHRDHPDFPLRRFVRCQCGRALTGSWSRSRTGTRYGFYHCPNGCRRIPKPRLEESFLALLALLKPQPGFWRVFEAAVVDTWREEHRRAGIVVAASAERVVGLEKKLRRLEDAYLADDINQASYRAKRDELREQLAIARMDHSAAANTEVDIEGLLAFTRHAIEHAGAFWTNAQGPEQRLKVQWLFFPQGLRLRPLNAELVRTVYKAPVSAGLFSPALSCSGLFKIDPASGNGAELVDHRGPTWNQIAAWLMSVAELRSAA